MSNKPVNVFITYSWEDEAHKDWAKQLANELLEEGVEAVIDQYDMDPGDRLPQFMEQSITGAVYVLIICTPKYKEKADKRLGGVGYECHLMAGELLTKRNERKYIPVIRRGNAVDALPAFLSGKLAIDLSEKLDKMAYDQNFRDLVATLRGERKKPPVRSVDPGNSRVEVRKQVKDKEPIRIEGIITDEVTVPRMDGTRGSALYAIPFRLSRTPSAIWEKLFIHEWDHPMSWSTMHRPGIARIYGSKLILDGTTIEEVKKYHRDMLMRCVEEANRKETAILEAQERERQAEEKRKADHAASVRAIADDISF